jgi:Pyruvate/2-oxoglutarate dehydrogenase complex, dehydrogenase (E1) component, eukaryotic type, beta subunit
MRKWRGTPLVFAMGEDIGVAGGTYKATSGLFAKYGEQRVVDTPSPKTATRASVSVRP